MNKVLLGRLKYIPNDKCVSEEGHPTPRIRWLKLTPNVKCFSEAGHTTPRIDWLN